MFLSTRHCYYTFLLLIVCSLFMREASAQKMRDTKYEKGTLVKGQKTGIWEYYGYTPSGEKVVLQRYDYDQHRLLYFRPGPDITCHTEVSPGK
jgi:protein TonB